MKQVITFFYLPFNHLRVNLVVPSYSSVVCSPLVTFGSRRLPPVWYRKARTPPSPPFSVWCGRAPSLVSHSQRPQVWYRIARAPPTLWVSTGSTSLSSWCGLVPWNPPHLVVCGWVSLSCSVVWCGRMSLPEHTATTYKDRCSGLAASMRRRLEGQGVQR